MKRWMVMGLGAMLLAGQVALAKAPADVKVNVVADWNKNPQTEYRYEVVTKKYENQALKDEKWSKGLMVNRRLRKDKESYIFELQFRDNETNDPTYKLPQYKKWLDEANQQKILYRVGKEGGFMGIQNPEELQKVVEQMVDLMWEEAKAKNSQQPLDESLKERLKANLTSSEYIENTYTQEVKVLCDMYGLELQLNDPFEFETELPIGFDSDVICPAKYVAELKEYNPNTGLSKIEAKVTPQAEAFGKIIGEFLQKLTGKAADPELLKMMGQIDTSVSYSVTYDVKRKVITKLYYINDTTFLTSRNTVEKTLELVSGK